MKSCLGTPRKKNDLHKPEAIIMINRLDGCLLWTEIGRKEDLSGGDILKFAGNTEGPEFIR